MVGSVLPLTSFWVEPAGSADKSDEGVQAFRLSDGKNEMALLGGVEDLPWSGSLVLDD